MKTLAEIINGVIEKPDIFVTGTVVAVDEGSLSCDVAPDDGGEYIRNAALRVMRFQNDAGFTVVPKLGTEVIVAWLAPNRPTVIQVQTWAKVLCLTTSGFGFAVDEGKVRLGKRDRSTHAVPLGDSLEQRINTFEDKYNSHQHPTGSTPDQLVNHSPAFNSTEVFTS